TAYGDGPGGTLWKIVRGTNSVTTLATFTQSPSGVTLDAQGNLFGTAGNTIWEFAKGSSTVRTLATIGNDNSIGVNGGLTLGTDGQLYGTTQAGGDYGDGSVFVFSTPEPSSMVMTVIISTLVGATALLKHRRVRNRSR